MAYPVTLNGRTYTLADFEGTNYVDGLPDAFEDFVTHAGNTYQTTSTTSIALGTGTKVFTVADSGKPYASGTPLRISNQADATDYIDALVTTYTGTTLTVNAIGYSGTGTIAAWNINIGGGPITVAGTLPINQGGTGATTASAAATALGLGTGDTPTFAGLNVTGTANFGDVNITNVGDIALDTISSDAGTSVTVNLGSDAGDDFIVGSNYLVVEGDTGNVGIGLNGASPIAKLDVVTGTDQRLLFTNNSGTSLISSVNAANTAYNELFLNGSDVRFGTSLSERMRIDGATGNVGIGLNGASPASKLHVNGSFRQTGATAPFEWTVNAGANDYYKLNSVGYSDNIIVATAAGDVGIGTSVTGDAELVVYGPDAATIYKNVSTGTGTGDGFFVGLAKSNGTDAYVFQRENTRLILGTNNTDRLIINSDGNILISGAGVPASSGAAGRFFDTYNLGTDATSFSTHRLITNNVAGTGTSSADIYKRKNGQFTIANNETDTAAYMNFQVGTQSHIHISNTGGGSVGVGTQTPVGESKLTVANGSLSITGSDQNFGGGGVRGMLDLASGYLRMGAVNGGGSAAGVNIVTPSGGSGILMNSSGNVGIGSTTSLTNKLRVLGDNPTSYTNAQFEIVSNAGNVVQSFHAGGATAVIWKHPRGVNVLEARNNADSGYININAALFVQQSDYRLKENIVPISDATERLKKLNPVRFNFKPFEETGEEHHDNTVDGFLAHEVSHDSDGNPLVPGAVTGEKDGMRDEQYVVTPAVEATYDDDGNILTEAVPAVMGTRSVPNWQGLDASKLVPLLVKTIQELEARITALEAN